VITLYLIKLWFGYPLFEVVENVERVIAIELLAACQAIEFLRPLKTTVPLEEVYNVVRSVVR
jgi:histidine ammonia-lyase